MARTMASKATFAAWLRPSACQQCRWVSSGAEGSSGKRSWTAAGSQRAFMDMVAREEGVRKPEDWRKVRASDVVRHGGGSLLRRHSSFFDLLRSVYPEAHLAVFQCRPQVPRGYWTKVENRKDFVDRVAEAKGLAREQMPQLTKEDIVQAGGLGLLAKYCNSVKHLVHSVYPDVAWDEPRGGRRTARAHWEAAGHRRRFMEQIGSEMAIEGPEGWKEVSAADIAARGGSGLLARYDSVLELLRDVFPEQEWRGSQCRPRMDAAHWLQPEHQREVLLKIAEECNVREWPQDWAKVTYEDIRDRGGRPLLAAVPRVLDLLQSAFPEWQWVEAECRPQVPEGYWEEPANCRSFLECLERRWGLEDSGDWSKVTREEVIAAGGGTLLANGSSLHGILSKAFPERQWDPLHLRCRLPAGYWEEEEAVKRFVASVAQMYDARDPAELLRLSKKQVTEAGGATLLRTRPWHEAVEVAYPDADWATLGQQTRAIPRCSQHTLYLHLRNLVAEAAPPTAATAQ